MKSTPRLLRGEFVVKSCCEFGVSVRRPAARGACSSKLEHFVAASADRFSKLQKFDVQVWTVAAHRNDGAVKGWCCLGKVGGSQEVGGRSGALLVLLQWASLPRSPQSGPTARPEPTVVAVCQLHQLSSTSAPELSRHDFCASANHAPERRLGKSCATKRVGKALRKGASSLDSGRNAGLG